MKRTLLALTLLLTACGTADTDTGASKAEAAAEASAAAADARRIAENEAALKQREQERLAAEAKAAAEAELPPEPSEFVLAVDVLEKQCFGSAGCNVTFRIDVSYNGTKELADLEITYEVVGGEDPIINTFEVDSNGDASVQSQETVSTSSSKSVLTAKVTKVRKA